MEILFIIVGVLLLLLLRFGLPVLLMATFMWLTKGKKKRLNDSLEMSYNFVNSMTKIAIPNS
jgi:hypothetical protein